MSSSLHVSLPDELRQFVDQRTNGKKQFSTPSEYVRALIRQDMEKEEEKQHVYKELLKSNSDVQAGRVHPASVIIDRTDRLIEKLRALKEDCSKPIIT